MLVWCIVGLAAAPSNWIWQRLSERASPWIAMIAAYLLEAVGVAAAALGDHLLAVFLGALLLGGTFMAITALGIERDGFRNGWLAISSSMTDGENSMAGVYITQVPSPGALGLLAAGLPMLLWRRRRAR